MPPTFFNLAQTVQGLSLRAALTGGEKISNIYSDKFDVVIIYSSTEMGYPACTFTVDHPYDRTPAGYPTGDTYFHIIDENGKIRNKYFVLKIHNELSGGDNFFPIYLINTMQGQVGIAFGDSQEYMGNRYMASISEDNYFTYFEG